MLMVERFEEGRLLRQLFAAPNIPAASSFLGRVTQSVERERRKRVKCHACFLICFNGHEQSAKPRRNAFLIRGAHMLDLLSNVAIEPPSNRAKPACEGRSPMACWASCCVASNLPELLRNGGNNSSKDCANKGHRHFFWEIPEHGQKRQDDKHDAAKPKNSVYDAVRFRYLTSSRNSESFSIFIEKHPLLSCRQFVVIDDLLSLSCQGAHEIGDNLWNSRRRSLRFALLSFGGSYETDGWLGSYPSFLFFLFHPDPRSPTFLLFHCDLLYVLGCDAQRRRSPAERAGKACSRRSVWNGWLCFTLFEGRIEKSGRPSSGS